MYKTNFNSPLEARKHQEAGKSGDLEQQMGRTQGTGPPSTSPRAAAASTCIQSPGVLPGSDLLPQ